MRSETTSPPPPPPPPSPPSSTGTSTTSIVAFILLSAIVFAAYFRNDTFLTAHGEAARTFGRKTSGAQHPPDGTKNTPTPPTPPTPASTSTTTTTPTPPTTTPTTTIPRPETPPPPPTTKTSATPRPTTTTPTTTYTVVNQDDADDLVDDYNSCGDVSSYVFADTVGVDVPRTCIELSPRRERTQRRRCFRTYIPQYCQATKVPMPVVFDLHGAGSCSHRLATYSQWKEIADNECIVVVWPEGTVDKTLASYACWSVPGGRTYWYLNNTLDEQGSGEEVMGRTPDPCCCKPGTLGLGDDNDNEETRKEENPWGVPIDDSVVLRFMIEVVLHQFNEERKHGSVGMDSSRVYMAGHSNGCIAALSMGALHSDIVAAVACHAGEVITPYDLTGTIYGNHRPERSVPYLPTPTWIVHGVDDHVLSYFGGTNMFMGDVVMPSIEANFHYIADSNGCSTEILTEKLGVNHTRLLRRSTCTNNADVVFLSVGTGHFPYVFDGLNTTKLAWEFVSLYSLDSKK